jgi:membrane-associated phospholipid phosphatase
MAPRGNFSASFSRTYPYTQANIFAQPFDWLETGFRYSTVSNRLYGPAALSGDQSYKDKSIDAKIRLWRESFYAPEVAVGFRDLAGTGLFSGEYVVASKRTGDFDWSLGMGWGYPGGRGNIRNPLGRLSPKFDTRTASIGQGGNFGFGSYFRGPASIFGGVQYQSPWERVVLKLEYDGNDYQHEPQFNNQRQSSPFNFGVVYRAARSVDITASIQRGNTFTLGIAFHTQLDGMETPKPNDPPRVPVVSARPQGSPDWSRTSRDIATQADWRVRRIEQRDRELRVTIDDPESVYLRDRLDKATSVLHRDAPPTVDRFALSYRQRGLGVAEHVVDRDEWARQRTELLPGQTRREAVVARRPESPYPSPDPAALYESTPPVFEHGLGFDYQQTLGGPDGFVLFQISAIERAKLRIGNSTWLQGSIRLGLIDNYDKFKFTAPSNLPRVRTFLREYLTTSALTIPNLQATHVGKIGDNQFYSVYAGYLESMFGGVGAEWLYKAPGSRTAFGVDLNAVRQRSFEQDFGFRNYKVATGHATLYWDTGWQDVQARLSVGRYLAGDFGATLDMSRAFRNGVTIGAFATKTNVSAAQFGEGSFDKGIYLSIPFDAMLTRSTNTIGNFVWKPLTRDGGAMLARANTLHGLTYTRNERTMWFEPAPRHNDDVIPADRREAWAPRPTGPEPFLQVAPKPAVSQFAPGSGHEHWLVQELYRQGFRNINVAFDSSHRLSVTASNDTLRPLSRAVGRAARTALRLSPLDTREIRVTLAERIVPVVTYEFVDLPRLDSYLGGKLSAKDLAPTVAITYLVPGTREPDPILLLSDLDTTEVSPRLAEFVPGYRSAVRVGEDVAAAGSTAAGVKWLRAGALGTGLVLASSALDKRAFKYSSSHANSNWLKAGTKVGNALPWVGLGVAAALAMDGSDPKRSATAFAAVEAGGVAFAAATGLKYLAGRARPESGLGPRSFKPGSSQDAFPSRHAMVAWALATPFAEEYDAKWLYGAAALTSLARVGSREHWVSDVVAGSLLGYGIGRIFWESSRNRAKGSAQYSISPAGVNVGWALE